MADHPARPPAHGQLTTTQVLFFCCLASLLYQTWRHPIVATPQGTANEVPSIEELIKQATKENDALKSSGSPNQIPVPFAARSGVDETPSVPPALSHNPPPIDRVQPSLLLADNGNDVAVADDSVGEGGTSETPDVPEAWQPVWSNVEGGPGLGNSNLEFENSSPRGRVAKALALQRQRDAEAVGRARGLGSPIVGVKASMDASLLYSADRSPDINDLIVFVHCPKTGGSSFYDTLRSLTMKSKIMWYPDGVGGSASFTDSGCGLPTGAAHCDFSEVEACLSSRYTRHMPRSSARFATEAQHRKYVTVLRHPVSRVTSEFFFACVTKKKTKSANKLMKSATGYKAMLDWSNEIWLDMDHNSCNEYPMGAFRRWVDHEDNPSHARYARFLLPRQLQPGEKPSPSDMGTSLLYRVHNCLAGDFMGTLSHWRAMLRDYGVSVDATLKDVTAVMNSNQQLRDAAISTFLNHFWFVGILEHLDEVRYFVADSPPHTPQPYLTCGPLTFCAPCAIQSYHAFCKMWGMQCHNRPVENEAMKHAQGSAARGRSKFKLDAKTRKAIEGYNRLDLHLYDTAMSCLESTGALRQTGLVYRKHSVV